MSSKYPSATKELLDLGYQRGSIAHLNERIKELQSAKTALSSSTVSSTPTTHGGTRYEDKLDKNIMACDAAEVQRDFLLDKTAASEAALLSLINDERTVLELCYVERYYSWAVEATKRLHIAQCTAYRLRDTALEHYVAARGV